MNINQARALASCIAFFGNRLKLIDAYGIVNTHFSKSRVAILTYHRVAEPTEAPWSLPAISPGNFENQIKYLLESFEILTIDTLVKYLKNNDHLPEKAIVLTFDDGYKDNYTYAFPILKKYNLPATISITTENIDRGDLFWWDKIGFVIWNTQLKEIDLRGLGKYSLHSVNHRLRTISRIVEKIKGKSEHEKRFILNTILDLSGVHIPDELGRQMIMSWDDVLEMNNSGITFGAHTLTHRNLSMLSLDEARYEIAESKRIIEGKLGQDVTSFCYPGGNFSPKIANLVRDAGFECALTLIPKLINREADIYQLGRISGGWNVDTLKLFVLGPYPELAGRFPTSEGE